MQTAREVLLDLETQRLNKAADELAWEKLGRRARTLAALWWLRLGCWCTALLLAPFVMSPGVSGLKVVVILALLMLGIFPWALLRRDVALREVIRREAPQLHDRLTKGRYL